MTPISWTIDDVITATGGRLLSGKGAVFASISIDSRTIAPENLFAAVRGDRFDGHDFIPGVLAAGVKGVMVNASKADTLPLAQYEQDGICVIAVEDTVAALGALASFQRSRVNIPVVAVTGSNGKTTTKEMIAAVLSVRFATLFTTGNLNNEIGLPLTLFRLSASHEAAVLEMGMNHPGEIDRLAAMCRPCIGVITTIGPAHLEGLGSMDAVMAAKGELLSHIESGGTAVLNADNPYCRRLAEKAAVDVFRFGLDDTANAHAADIRPEEDGTRFTLSLGSEKIEVRLRLAGAVNVSNALAAASVGHLLGLSAAEIAEGLASVRPVKGRMEIIRLETGVTLIDDTYNANPGSMAAAIGALMGLRGPGRTVLVAGDMLELGGESEKRHEDIGALAARSGIDQLYLTGQFAPAAQNGAVKAGMPAGRIRVDDKAAIIDSLIRFLRPGDRVLVKGSRSMGMETIVKGLQKS